MFYLRKLVHIWQIRLLKTIFATLDEQWNDNRTRWTSCSHLPALFWQKHSHLPSLCLPCNHHHQDHFKTIFTIWSFFISSNGKVSREKGGGQLSSDSDQARYPKLDSKRSWQWRIIFIPATIWNFLNVILTHDWKWKLCESAEICLGKFVKSHQLNFGGF